MKFEEEEEDKTLFQRYRWWILVGAPVLVALVLLAGISLSKQEPPPRERQSMVIQAVLPPPPPPPPPPPEPEVQEIEEEMVELEPDEANEPDEAPPPDNTPATGITGDGPPDGFGLAGSGGPVFGGRGGSGRENPWAAFANSVQASITDAIRRHSRTRVATVDLEVRIWTDPSGRITRVHSANSAGDPEIDRILRSEVLIGLQLASPPPEDMPMPVVMRISARRPI
ncbi:MAG: hypothetical protein ACNA77_02295 [Opitutales bacterium]